MGATILVLGGGVGGVVASNLLRRWLPAENRVVLVEREPRFVFAPSLLWLMTGDRTADRISRPLARLHPRGIDVVQGEVEKIDAQRREVTVAGATHVGDWLVVALGADLAPEVVPGLKEAGHGFYSLAGAEGLRDALASFPGGRLVVLTAAPAYKCPAAPYEAAMLLESFCRRRGLGARARVDLYAAEPGPMGVAGPEVSRAVRGMVEAKGIGYHPEHQVVEVEPGARRLRFASGADAPFDLLAYVPPHRAPRVVREAGLLAESGWMAVDRSTLATRYQRVFAIGDVVGIPLQMGKPLPKAGVFARAEAEVVARNIAHAITGRGRPAAFDGRGSCFIETGDGRAGYGAGNFYAEPLPDVKVRAPGRIWHAGKVLFEADWLRRWF
jgi:sulfide:quinone oxidoreductase